MKKIILIVAVLLTVSYAATTPTHVIHMNNGDIHVVKLVESTSKFFIVETSDGENMVIPILDVKMIKKIEVEESEGTQPTNQESISRDRPTEERVPAPVIETQPDLVETPIPVLEEKSSNEQFRRITIGLAVPGSPTNFVDYWNNGFHLGFEQITKLNEGLHMGVEVDYSFFSLDEDAMKASVGADDRINISGGDASIYNILVKFKVGIKPPPENPVYVQLGFGYYRLKFSDLTVSGGGESESVSVSDEHAFGINPGLGLLIPIKNSKTSLCFEIGYMIGFTESDITTHLPIKVGVVF